MNATFAAKTADYAIAFAGALVLTLVLTPLVRETNRRLGMVDKPDARRINKTPIPRGGGLALILGLFVSYTAFALLSGRPAMQSTISGGSAAAYWKFLALSCGIGAIGLADDRFGMDPRVKLGGQLLCAFLAWAWLGVGFSCLWPQLHPALDCILTIVWITGAVNAFNLIDGLDGLASGLALIASLGMAGSLILTDAAQSSLFHFAFAGALVGFLRYNYNPASVFLGDCGSMFIGFTLAVLPLAHQTPGSFLVSVGVPLLAMGVPIFDVFLAIFRRTLRRILKKREGVDAGNGKVMTADTDHLHHRILRAAGMNQRKATFILYTLAFVAVAIGLFAVTLRSHAGGLWIIAVALGSAVAFRDMSRIELFDAGRLLNTIARNNTPASRRKWARISTPVYLTLDIVSLAFTAFACMWAPHGAIDRDFLRIELPLRVVCVVAALVALDTYRTVWARAMASNFFRLLTACVAGTAVSSTAIYYSPAEPGEFVRTSLMYAPLAFLLLTATRMARTVVRDLFYALDRKRLMAADAGKGGVSRILVYGAGLRYRSFRRELVRSASANNRFIVGLIDDDLLLRGKFIGGVEVMGTLLQAPEIIKKTRAAAVVIACDTTDAWLKVVRETLEPTGVKTTRFRFSEETIWENTQKKK